VNNPDFAPLMQRNLSGLPQTLIVTCEFDVLRDEGAIYAERMRDADVQVHTVVHLSAGWGGLSYCSPFE
jgi:acetyl esterase